MRPSTVYVLARAYAIPVAACIVSLTIWLMRLVSSSLWLDETLTYWIVKDGLSQTIDRSQAFQNTGPVYYIFLWPLVHLLPPSEITLRILSALSVLLAVVLLYNLAKFFLDREGALTASLLFVVSEGILPTLANARPYSLGMLLVITCAYSMMVWLNAFRLRYLLFCVLTTVLAYYTHYLVAPVLAVFLAYMAGMVLRLGAKARVAQVEAGLALLLIALLSIPSVSHLKLVANRREILQFSEIPNLHSLLGAWIPVRLVLFIVAALVVAYLIRPVIRFSWRKVSVNRAVLLLGWHLIPPLSLFLFSRLMSASIFNLRYLVWMIPAGAILTACGTQMIRPSRVRRLFVSFVLAGLALAATRNEILIEDWSGAIHWTQREADRNSAAVLASTMLVEAADTSLLNVEEGQDYMLAPFSFYRLDERAVPLPLWFDQDGGPEYLERRVRPAMRSSGRVLLIARLVEMHSDPRRTSKMVRSDRYLTARLSEWGWKVTDQRLFGSVIVLDLRR